jgi:soluble lytic murein transglycosylase-like protein
MRKFGILAVAFAAGFQPFAAHSMTQSPAVQSLMLAVGRVASAVETLNDATLSAQDRIGFPATPAEPLEDDLDNAFGAIIARHAGQNGVPVALARAVIGVESGYRPNAKGSAGEVGLMQIKPATARDMGYRGSASGLFHPETNIRFGMKYLGIAHRLGGGATCQTILKYNAGHAAKRMNPVSRAYCAKVKRALAS